MNDILLAIAKEAPALLALIWIVARFLSTLNGLQSSVVKTATDSATAIAANTAVLRELTQAVRSLNGAAPAGQGAPRPATVGPRPKTADL